MDELVKKYVLQNSVKYNGKANSGAVLGKILQENIKLKSKIKILQKKINDKIKEISKLNVNEQLTRLKEIAPELLEKKKEKKKELKRIKSKNPMLRFEPSPSGALHVGHAYALGLNEIYRKKYNGKLILRIGDTNPENIYKKAYKLIEEDAKWLSKISKVFIQSDRLKIYYKYAEKIIKKGKAYICTCDPEKFKKLIEEKKACPCRNLEVKEQLKRWKLMLSKYKEGQAVMRIKTDLKNKNPALRDWPALRINLKKHPKVGHKYRVWPLMNFAVVIDDHDLGITTVIRCKDHKDNAIRQKYLFDYFKWKFPETLFGGLINFTDLKLSATEITDAIKKKKYDGWDDIRLPSIAALRRRGYQKEAFLRYAEEVGITEVDKKISKEEYFKMINAFNTNLIDEKANRYFLILNPKKIKIKKAPEFRRELDLYPGVRLGGRRFLTKDEFYIQDKLEKNKNYRLMHLFNFRNKEFISEDMDDRLDSKLIHWLPKVKGLVKIEVLMENNEIVKGLGEESLKKVSKGEIIQAERIGFLKALSKDKFIFLHR